MRSKTKSTPTSEKKIRRSRSTSKTKRATAGDQQMLFSQATFKVLEEIKFGDKGTHLRLIESESGKRYIQCWSSLSKQWNNMHRYNVNEEWLKWKATHARIHDRRSKNKTKARRDVQLERTADNAGRTTKPKARTVSVKDLLKNKVKKGSGKGNTVNV